MRRRDVLGLLAGAALPWPRPARASQATLDETVAFAGQILFLSLKTPALILGVIQNGHTSIRGSGRIAGASSEAPGPDTLFTIGSISKAFNGQVLASLATDGVVGLSDPLSKYLPQFAAPLSEGERPITLVDLATHSSGLPRDAPHELWPPNDPLSSVTHEAFTAWLKGNPLLFAPGTEILYCNFGFALLAAALAAASSKPYPELLDTRVLRPLGLSDTMIFPSAGQSVRVMQGHDSYGAALPVTKTVPALIGAGGLHSTPRDMLHWHLDRLSNERATERLIDHAAYLWRDGMGSVVGMDESGHMDAMGLGWVIMEAKDDRPVILQKAGGNNGVLSYVAFAPSHDIGALVAINVFDFGAGMAMAKAANALIAQLAPR